MSGVPIRTPLIYGGIHLNNPVLKLEGIKKSFGGVHALKGVDVEIYKGETHALVGENGAGKSTLMKILLGELRLDEGKIELNNIDITHKSTGDLEHLGMQHVHQVLNVVPSMTIAQNIMLGSPITKFGLLDWKKGYEKAEQALKMVSDSLIVTDIVENLSASEKQLVVLARSLISNPTLLILDEPTSRLGHEESERLFKILDSLKKKGITMIYISHRLEEIYRLSDRVTVLRDGNKIITEEIGNLTTEKLVKYMIGYELAEHVSKREIENIKEKEEPVLKVNSLKYEQKVGGVTFNVKHGEIVGLVGAVGSGKSEVLKMIFGALKPSEGFITLRNDINKFRKPSDAINAKIALVPEDRQQEGLIGEFSVMENISLADHKNQFKKGIINAKNEEHLAVEIIDKLSITPPMPHLSVKSLSGGNAQKVVIGKWITQKRCLYLFDEVTAGVDVGAKYEIYQIIRQFTREGAGVILATSDINEALGLCDRLLIFYKGRIIAEVSPEKTNREEILTYIMGGKKTA
jgi:ABC-type sugar transport system ATPase subunit